MNKTYFTIKCFDIGQQFDINNVFLFPGYGAKNLAFLQNQCKSSQSEKLIDFITKENFSFEIKFVIILLSLPIYYTLKHKQSNKSYV